MSTLESMSDEERMEMARRLVNGTESAVDIRIRDEDVASAPVTSPKVIRTVLAVVFVVAIVIVLAVNSDRLDTVESPGWVETVAFIASIPTMPVVICAAWAWLTAWRALKVAASGIVVLSTWQLDALVARIPSAGILDRDLLTLARGWASVPVVINAPIVFPFLSVSFPCLFSSADDLSWKWYMYGAFSVFSLVAVIYTSWRIGPAALLLWRTRQRGTVQQPA